MLLALLGLPRFVLKKVIQRRQKKFLEEFADALDAVVRLLKAGMPVSEAISMMSREFEGPVGEEMSIIYDKQKIGVPLHEAAGGRVQAYAIAGNANVCSRSCDSGANGFVSLRGSYKFIRRDSGQDLG